MKKLYSIPLLIALLAVMIPAAPVQAQSETQTVTLQPGAAGMKDNSLSSFNASQNYGGLSYFAVGENNGAAYKDRALLEFDLSGLPYDMTVVSATLTLTVKADYSSNTRTMYAYCIINDWVEDQSSWNYRKATNIAWETAGVEGATDVDPTFIGSVSVADNLAVGDTVVMTLLPAAVQEMAQQNCLGFKLQMDVESDDAYEFYSSDDATEANRPKMVIEYSPDTPFVDPGWFCFEGGSIWSQSFPECLPDPPEGYGNTIPYMNYYPDSYGGEVSINYGGATVASPIMAARLNCDPYPRCVNDYPIYYRITVDAGWTAMGSTEVTLTTEIWFNGSTNIILPLNCGVGVAGQCKKVYEGVIPIADLPINTDNGWSVGVLSRWNAPTSWALSGNGASYTLYLSLEPFDQDCTDIYTVPVPETFVIDPLIEEPLGMLGTPADDQIYTTVPGQIYMVHVKDGPWNDGTTERTDAAVSEDGVTWVSLQDFTADALCISSNPLSPGDDYRYVFFTATTETFYIRANDTAGAFANNANNGTTPFSYVMGEAFLIAATTCASQFTYDPTEDLLASVMVDSELEDRTTVDAVLQVGEWYAIEVADGTWAEPPYDVPLITMQYINLSGGLFWSHLAEGAANVECASGNVVYLQALDTQLHLRADDVDGFFNNNIGILDVNVYHTSYQRAPETCELSFALNDQVREDSVDAKQVYGKVFGMAVGSALTNNNEQTENYSDYGLVPGAWYALETLGGPWGYPGTGESGASNYNLAVLEEAAGATTTNLVMDWGPLAEWDLATCNVETDKLGHRMVYFQVPVTVASQWRLRVDDTAYWTNNTGVMSWKLYRAIDLGPTDSGLCDYSYDPANKVTLLPTVVSAQAVNGAPIERNDLVGGGLALLPNTYYAIEILGSEYSWAEQAGGAPLTTMELSLNNGQTWGNLPGGGELCAVTQGDNLIFYLHTGAGAPEFKLRVDSTTFDNNSGEMGWNVYTAEAGTSINPYDGCVTEGYDPTAIGPIEWIPVKDAMGRGITSTSASYAEIGGLVPGNKYIVETSRGPWTDGETTFDNSTNLAPQFGAQVSSDDGVTWQSMDGTNTDITCWETSPDFKYRKIEFTVEAGQSWKIRVADINSAGFEDNEGQLAYTLKGLVLPTDSEVNGTFNLVGCNAPAISPGTMSIAELPNLGNFLAEWVDYWGASILSFFAWCPDNTDAVTMFTSDLQTKEPFATTNETKAILNDVKNEINGYDWGSSGTDFSILTKPPAQSAAMMEEYIFGKLPDDSPWLGGDLVDMTVVPNPTQYFETCQSGLNDYVGPLLGQGVCFASNWAKEIGFIFWIQLGFDVAVIFACIHEFFGVFKGLMYLATGVNFGQITPTTVVTNVIERGKR